MVKKTNYIRGVTGPVEELLAYREICDYLVAIGTYPSRKAAISDARERVKFCADLGLYDQPSNVQSASDIVRSTHALIYAHDLHDLIESNGGYLPDAKPKKISGMRLYERIIALFRGW